MLANWVWKRAIEPAIQRLAQVQLAGYEHTTTTPKPKRALVAPDDEPIRAFVSDWTPPPPMPPLVGDYPGRPPETAPPPEAVKPRTRRGPRVVTTTAALALAGGFGSAALRRPR